MVIDRKYRILAINPCSGNIHTEEDAILFLAKDKALLPILSEYYKQCKILECDEFHLESIDLLTDRITEYQRTKGFKIPDTNTLCEIDRCIGGKL